MSGEPVAGKTDLISGESECQSRNEENSVDKFVDVSKTETNRLIAGPFGVLGNAFIRSLGRAAIDSDAHHDDFWPHLRADSA